MSQFINPDATFDINSIYGAVKGGDVLPKGRGHFLPKDVTKEESVFVGAKCVQHKTGALVVFRVGNRKFVVAGRDELTTDWTVLDIALSMKVVEKWADHGVETCACTKPRWERKQGITKVRKTPVRKAKAA